MMRGGTNKLRIETGRWRGEKREERVCRVCLCEEVEDEKHFILACPMYVRERVEMFDKIRESCEVDVEIMDQDSQIDILIGIGWRKKGKEIRQVVVDYIRKANEIRSKYA